FERLIRAPQNPVGRFLSRRIKGAAEYAGGSRSDVAGLLIKSPRQFTILTTVPQPSLPDLLTLLSCSIVKAGGEEPGARPDAEARKILTSPMGSGPFMLPAGSERAKLVLRSFPQYFAGPPYLDRIEISSRKTVRQPSALFRVGKLDLLELAAAD